VPGLLTATPPPAVNQAVVQTVLAQAQAQYEAGQRRLPLLREQYQPTFPAACHWLAEAAAARWHHRTVPAQYRQYNRTSHQATRAFEEKRRWTKVIPPLWADASWVKRVFAVLMHVSERWGKKQYRKFAPHQRRALRQALGVAQSFEVPSLGPLAPQPRRSVTSARDLLQETKDLTQLSSHRPPPRTPDGFVLLTYRLGSRYGDAHLVCCTLGACPLTSALSLCCPPGVWQLCSARLLGARGPAMHPAGPVDGGHRCITHYTWR
jgi:hypothetical protein